MTFSHISARIQNRYRRIVSDLMFTRPVEMHNRVAYVSFTFDDFPRSALHKGGKILLQSGARATFYVSLGLMGTTAPTGSMFLWDDLKELLGQGHELGCHTFAHCDAWNTAPRAFEDSIVRNRLALEEYLPGAAFTSFSYPISVPRPRTKHTAGKYFLACRCGGQSYNAGRMDLNLLKAFFIEKSRNDLGAIRSLIDRNSQDRGWLIFATHDIANDPTDYGCTPHVFDAIVKYCVVSGARILPLREALNAICKEDSMNAISRT